MISSTTKTSSNPTTSSSPLPSSPSLSWNVFAVAAVAVLLGSVHNWHASMKQHEWHQQPHRQRVLLWQGKGSGGGGSGGKGGGGSIDDDITRDDTCRDYLMNFLNGTTDAKDECTAMSRAWDVADCKDYSNDEDSGKTPRLLQLFEQIVGDNDKTKNKTADDDVMIDDAFEKWECCSSITDFYGKHCREQQLNAFRLLSIVAVLIVCGLCKAMMKNIPRLKWIPSAAACIVVGAMVGGMMRLFVGGRNEAGLTVQDRLLSFNNDLFLHILLPPIVFEAAISIDKKAFRRDFFPILTFAILGTGFSAVAIGYITFGLTSALGGQLPLLDSLLFGALMSSIDPVATLGILSSVGVSQRDTLYTLIFGESLLNDGVAIVLFDSLVRHMGDDQVVDHATVQNTLVHFCYVSVASILIGALCGALATFYFSVLRRKQTAVTEVALFFAWALVPYYIADGLALSGIISIMVMGFVMDYFVIGGNQNEDGEWMEYMERRTITAGGHGHLPTPPMSSLNLLGGSLMSTGSLPGSAYHPVEPWFDRLQKACSKAFSGRGHISSKSRHHVGFCAEVISTIMETAIFAYLGLFLFNDRVWSFKITISGLFACVSSRAVMVILLSLLINICVWLDLENSISKLFRYCCCPSSSGGGRNGYGQNFNNNNNNNAVRNFNDDDSADFETPRVYLDKKTQIILFSAGVRGAVSYALVQNIPVYDSVTKTGSHFKGELRSMTSFSIMIILFAFGALTYFTVQQGMGSPDQDRVAGSLTHRLLSTSLHSDEGQRRRRQQGGVDGDEEEEDELDSDDEGDNGNSTFEIESPPRSREASRTNSRTLSR